MTGPAPRPRPHPGSPAPRRGTPPAARPTAPTTVVCPVCRDEIPWAEKATQVYEWVRRDARYVPVDLAGLPPTKQDLRRSQSYVLCPLPQRDPDDQHYLPANYHVNGRPVVIGLVGRPSAGKTHLLVAMLAELFRGGGSAFGITEVTPLDNVQHLQFDKTMIEPFLDGRQLLGTSSGVRRYAESVQITTAAGTRTVVFFDIAGDDFRLVDSDAKDAEFLLNVNAVLFVEDIGEVRSAGNEWINGARQVLRVVPGADRLPTALVLAKADQERYTEPIDRWLRELDPAPRWTSRLREESRDLYAWLHLRRADYLLGLVESYERCTIHVASATGGPSDGTRFPRGVRPTRVLEPLAALLVAVGVLREADASAVRS